MLDKHFRMKIPNNLLVASLVYNLRMNSASEELASALICAFLTFIPHRALTCRLPSRCLPCLAVVHALAAFPLAGLFSGQQSCNQVLTGKLSQ